MTDLHRTWTADAGLLAAIGAALADQDLDVEVRLPADLAARAVAAWERDDVDDPPGHETAAERVVRGRAAALALLGAAIADRGITEGDEVVVRAHAWSVGSALDAADDPAGSTA